MARPSTAATLFTLAVGAALGVLIAPASGRETRRRLMEKGDGMKDTFHYLVMEAGDLLDQVRSLIGPEDERMTQRTSVGSGRGRASDN